MIKAAGRDEDTLECGVALVVPAADPDRTGLAWSQARPALQQLLRQACRLHLRLLPHGTDTEGYVGYDHPLQQEIRGIMESLTGSILGHDNCGVDGCSIPTYASPLKGWAWLCQDDDGRWPQADPRQIGQAPDAGLHGRALVCRRHETRLHRPHAGRPGRIFAKTGAEGVFVAAIPEQGIAMAMKCDDGATRAAESMVAATLARFFKRSRGAGESCWRWRITRCGTGTGSRWGMCG